MIIDGLSVKFRSESILLTALVCFNSSINIFVSIKSQVVINLDRHNEVASQTWCW